MNTASSNVAAATAASKETNNTQGNVLTDENSGRADIWVYDVRRKVGSRLTFDEMNDTNPVWSPDGARVAFQSNRKGPVGDIFVRRADGRGQAELLYSSEAMDTPEDWSPDGNYPAPARA